MTDAIPSKKQIPKDDLWSLLKMDWLEAPLREGSGPVMPHWEDFSERLDRYFQHVSLYVGKRVSDRKRLRYIVTEVLAGSLDLFTTPRDAQEDLRSLDVSADRLLALEAATLPGAGTSNVAAGSPRSRL